MTTSSESSGLPQLRWSGTRIFRILVAEDPFINSFIKTLLHRQGHKVVTSESSQACELLHSGELTVDLVITNCPGLFLEFADTLPLIYIAACPDPDMAALFRTCRVLRKPFRNEELREAVQDLLQFGVR